MELSKQVCTLEQSKKLKELGIVIGNPAFYYYESHVWGREPEISYDVVPSHNYEYGGYVENDSIADALNSDVKNEIYPAFTVAELGVMMPRDYDDSGMFFSIKDIGDNQGNEIKGYSCMSFLECGAELAKEAVYSTEAQARAALLIELLESGKMKPDVVNKYLQSA